MCASARPCRHKSPPNRGILLPARTIREEGGSGMEKKRDKRPMEKAMDLTAWQSAKTDPQGSWTGAPADPYETPVQDADDL